MATTTVITPQEIDSVIAYQERIEQQREQADREFEQRRKEYEEKRLKGKSHWAIAHRFARGATKGRGSRVFIEDDRSTVMATTSSSARGKKRAIGVAA